MLYTVKMYITYITKLLTNYLLIVIISRILILKNLILSV